MTSQHMPQSGDIIANRYHLLEPIGQGGFGTIYRAQQRPRPHEVAIKIMAYSGSPMACEEMLQRFRREAAMASHIVHPHAVRQFDFGDGGHFFYLSMELVQGQTIRERIQQQGPLQTALVRRIARATLDVLAMAHRKDIVHRDLKPDNIMLCRVDGQTDFPKVLDFGSAKTIEGHHDLTSQGTALGSPAYMPPELLLDEPPCPGSDLYSLALTLGEALIGTKIVPGDTPIERAKHQLNPQPIRFPSALQNHPMASWLRGALARDPANRYPSASAMLQALPQRSGPHAQPSVEDEPTEIYQTPSEPAPSLTRPRPEPTLSNSQQPHEPATNLNPNSYGGTFQKNHGEGPKATRLGDENDSEESPTASQDDRRDLEPTPEKDFKLVNTAQRRDRSEFIQPLIIGVFLMIIAVYVVAAIAS